MLTTIALIVFIVAVGLIFHSYAFYPWLLQWLLKRHHEKNIKQMDTKGHEPEITILFSAFNEEKVIREKLESIFSTNYPLSKLQVYIGSDNSTDSTNSIIAEFSSKYGELHFFPFKDRNGKSTVLNRLMKSLPAARKTGDSVLIFTDANVMFTPGLLHELTKPFADAKVGQVGANVLNKGMRSDGISFQEAGYIKRETQIKIAEGKLWGTMMGAFGACYAMRGDLWTDIPSNFLMEDFFLSMHIVSSGYDAMLAVDAICYEDVSNNVEEEVKRKTRIQAGNLQNLSVYWPMLLKCNAASFCFWSHKVIRWLGPVFILLAFLCTLVLLRLHPVFSYLLGLQVLLFASPAIDSAIKKTGLHITALRYTAYFYKMNYALVKGFFMFARGIETSVWKPTQRNL